MFAKPKTMDTRTAAIRIHLLLKNAACQRVGAVFGGCSIAGRKGERSNEVSVGPVQAAATTVGSMLSVAGPLQPLHQVQARAVDEEWSPAVSMQPSGQATPSSVVTANRTATRRIVRGERMLDKV
jgi:hypothetical protein